jgi:hypothetical protein
MHSSPILRKVFQAALLVALVLLTSCGGGGGPAGAGSGYASITLEGAFWGRLVDVFDGDGLPVEEDVMVRQGLASDGVQYTLSLNPVTQREILTIHTAWKDSQGNVRSEFQGLLDGAISGLNSVTAEGMETNANYTRVARNGALKLVFSEYLDPSSVNRLTMPIFVNDRITNVRYIVKEGEGVDGEARGFVFIDPTITPQDSANYLLPENGVGFEPSPDQVNGNGVLRIPTEIETAYGQTQVVTNKAGTRTLGVTPTDPLDFSDGFKEVVIRVFRTGNADDPANGFMKDNQRPELQADLKADIFTVADSGPLKAVTYRIQAAGCRAISAKVGDVLQTPSGTMLVTGILDSSNIEAVEVQCSVIDGTVSNGDFTSNPIEGDITTFYRATDEALQWCWIRFDPEPATLPATDVDPYATVSLRFSEPIDPSTVLSLGSMVVHSYNNQATPPEDHSGFDETIERVGEFIDRLPGYSEDDPVTPGDESGSGRLIFGPISTTADSRDFVLAPSAGFSDPFSDGVDLRFGLALRDGSSGVLDLAGNSLGFTDFVAGAVGQAAMTLDSSGGIPGDKYFTLRFLGVDENGDGLPEYAGQYLQDDGKLKGRDLIRYSRQADPNANQWIGQRAAWSQSGLATPLTPGGAVLVGVYGYHHMGFGVKAPSEYNLDVEGLNWSPFNGLVLDDFFPRYSIALAHCNRYPDDYIDTATGYPDYPKSGLKRNANFDDNILGFGVDPHYIDEKVVFDTSYDVIGSNTFVAESGAVYSPWPTFDSTYTWRDNSMAQDMTGGPDSSKSYGVPIKVTGQDPYYLAGEWPSVVAPLMMRFRCYPRGDFFGWNGFQVQIMVPSSNQPAFRVFSFGGNGSELVVPDVPEPGTKPTGGTGTGGGVQKGYGPELYWGQVDFVVKVSRTFTHWFSFGGVFNGIGTIVQEPMELPENTSISVDWRGAELIDLTSCATDALHLLNDANRLDGYGEFKGSLISRDRLFDPPLAADFCETLSVPSEWTSNPAALAAEAKWKFFQLRITFVSNIEKDLEPELDAYGFSWTVQ